MNINVFYKVEHNDIHKVNNYLVELTNHSCRSIVATLDIRKMFACLHANANIDKCANIRECKCEY